MERSSSGFKGNTPSRQPAKNAASIHGDAGKRVLARGRRQRQPLLQSEIPLRVLRRVGHQHQVRVAIGGDLRGSRTENPCRCRR